MGVGDEKRGEALVGVGIHIGVVEGGPEFVAVAAAEAESPAWIEAVRGGEGGAPVGDVGEFFTDGGAGARGGTGAAGEREGLGVEVGDAAGKFEAADENIVTFEDELDAAGADVVDVGRVGIKCRRAGDEGVELRDDGVVDIVLEKGDPEVAFAEGALELQLGGSDVVGFQDGIGRGESGAGGYELVELGSGGKAVGFGERNRDDPIARGSPGDGSFWRKFFGGDGRLADDGGAVGVVAVVGAPFLVAATDGEFDVGRGLPEFLEKDGLRAGFAVAFRNGGGCGGVAEPVRRVQGGVVEFVAVVVRAKGDGVRGIFDLGAPGAFEVEGGPAGAA